MADGLGANDEVCSSLVSPHLEENRVVLRGGLLGDNLVRVTDKNEDSRKTVLGTRVATSSVFLAQKDVSERELATSLLLVR